MLKRGREALESKGNFAMALLQEIETSDPAYLQGEWLPLISVLSRKNL